MENHTALGNPTAVVFPRAVGNPTALGKSTAVGKPHSCGVPLSCGGPYSCGETPQLWGSHSCGETRPLSGEIRLMVSYQDGSRKKRERIRPQDQDFWLSGQRHSQIDEELKTIPLRERIAAGWLPGPHFWGYLEVFFV